MLHSTDNDSVLKIGKVGKCCFVLWNKNIQLNIMKRHNHAELTSHHTHKKHTPQVSLAQTFHKLKNGLSIWFEVSKNWKGQHWPGEHTITMLLQWADAYHIVITGFIFWLGILCKQAFGVRVPYPSSPVFKSSKTWHVYKYLKLQAKACVNASWVC